MSKKITETTSPGNLTLADLGAAGGVAVDAMKPASNNVTRVEKTEYQPTNANFEPIIRQDIY